MFTRNGKTYAIRRNGKVYLPVRRGRNYWKEVTTTEEVEYNVVFRNYGYGIHYPAFAIKGSPKVGKKIHAIENFNESGINTFTFDVSSEELDIPIKSVEFGEESQLYGGYTAYVIEFEDASIVPSVTGGSYLPGQPFVMYITSALNLPFTKTQTETVTVTQPATPDDYTYYEDVLKYY